MKANFASNSYIPDLKIPTTRNFFSLGTAPIGVVSPSGETTVTASPWKTRRSAASWKPRMIPGRRSPTAAASEGPRA